MSDVPDDETVDLARYLIEHEGKSPEEAWSIANQTLTPGEELSAARALGRGMLVEEAERYQPVLLAYGEAKRLRRLTATLLVEYRCRSHRCLLLHCWMSPHGRYVVLPPYRWSSAFADDTTDQHRRRPARAFSLDHLIDVSKLPLIPLDCNHVSEYVEPEMVLRDAENRRPGAPRQIRIPRL